MPENTDNLTDFRSDPIAFFRAIGEGRDFAHFTLARRRFVLVNSRAGIRDVLVTRQSSFEKGPGLLRTEPILGEGLLTASNVRHRRTRKLVQPSFHSTEVEGHAPIMSAEIARWLSSRHDGETFDLHREMTGLTLSIAARTLFGADLTGESERVYDGVSEALQELYAGLVGAQAQGQAPQGIPVRYDDEIEPRSLPSPTLPEGEGVRSKKGFTNTSLKSEPLSSGEGLGRETLRPYLEALALCPAHRSGDDPTLLRLLTAAHADGNLTDRELADEAVTFLLAAHESVANALVWTFVLLAQNPGVEARLHEELDMVLDSGEPSIDDLDRLVYTQAVVAESLRHHPPAWMMSRVAVDRVDAGGEEIGRGTIVVLAPSVTHRDPRYWDEPDAFQPERWLSGNGLKSPAAPFTYFPFGAGARKCIGERFALQELALAVAAISRRYRIILQPGARIEPQPIVTLRPRYGCPVRITRR